MSSETTIARVDAGVLEVRGADRIDLLHRLSTNDLRPLERLNIVTTTVFTTNQGRVVDWSWVLSLPERLLVRTSAGRVNRLAEWIATYTITEDVET